MTFAMNPDGGPARIFRYVDPGTLPGLDILALYDKGQNLLIIDSVHFEKLTSTEKHLLLRTQQAFTIADQPHDPYAWLAA